MADANIKLDWVVDAIIIGARHRQDLGDLQPLMDSINDHGLLQPITITPEGVLICGARRLAALKALGHRHTSVWIRSGLSDRLSALMAERDENISHKEYTKVELAALYEELKSEIAADAARRKQATQFGAEEQNASSDGSAYLAEPWQGRSDSRRQAAQMLNGGASHMTLEKVLAIKEIAADTTRPEALRTQASEAITEIEAGQAVEPRFRKLRSAVRIDDLERIAANDQEPAEAREAARRGAILLRRLEEAEPMSDADLDKAARTALNRVQQARGHKKKTPPERKPDPEPPGPKYRSAKSFIWTWQEMANWPHEYDVTVIATALNDEQYQRFLATMADANEFTDKLTRLRNEAATADPSGRAHAPVI